LAGHAGVHGRLLEEHGAALRRGARTLLGLEPLRRNHLLLVVFVTGACVLAIEVAAVRILASYFGSTMYTVSSVLSVILAALSLGYYTGGRLADSRPSPVWFYLIITLSAFGVLFMQVLIEWALPGWGRSLDLVWGPLLSSLVLFLFPSFLLGMLSPYAVRLQHERDPGRGVATTAGKVFFWSTLGSIVGSLVTGFYLIPSLGLRQITLGIGLLLLVMGLAGLGISRRGGRGGRARSLLLLGLVGLLLLTGAAQQRRAEAGLFETDGRYERIRIFDTSWGGERIRMLQQDLSSDSAISLESDELPFEYARFYRLMLALNPEARVAAVIGGGAYTIPKKLVEDDPEIVVDVAEIEPLLLELSQQYFELPDTPRIRNHVMDGRRFLWDRPETFDAIFSDAYHSYLSIPNHMTTLEFFETVERALRPGGVFLANVIGSLEDEPPSFALSEMKTMRTVFENSYFIAVGSPGSSTIQNLIFVALKSDEPVDFDQLETPGSRVAERARENLLDPDSFDLDRHEVFTDDFAPIDWYMATMLRRAR
jgi:spermidine synthase